MIVRQLDRWLWTLPCVALFASTAMAQNPSAERLDEMRKLAREIVLTDGGSRTIELRTEPIVRYDDPLRQIDDATLWVFGERGRPHAALKVEIYARGHALHGLVSLAPAKITAEGESWGWSSTKPGIVLRPIPNAPAPADSDRARLIQLRALARRFTGFEVDANEHGRLQLRLLPKPIHRYDDSENQLQDGAIFSLANGTNPEVLLLIESRPAAGAKAPTWQYGLARLGGAPASVSLDDKEVWNIPKAYPPARHETYMNRTFPRKR